VLAVSAAKRNVGDGVYEQHLETMDARCNARVSHDAEGLLLAHDRESALAVFYHKAERATWPDSEAGCAMTHINTKVAAASKEANLGREVGRVPRV